MCEGSIHVPHRMARETERLVIDRVPDMGPMKGYYPALAREHHTLVCCRGRIDNVIIKQVQFEKGLPVRLTRSGRVSATSR